MAVNWLSKFVVTFVLAQLKVSELPGTNGLFSTKLQLGIGEGDGIRFQMQDRRRLAEEQGLQEAQELLRKLEESTAELAKGDVGKKDALAQMNDLS